MNEKRFYWTWYWPQSVELVAGDLQGWPTREEAIKDAEAAGSALRRTWGPGKGFQLSIEEVVCE